MSQDVIRIAAGIYRQSGPARVSLAPAAFGDAAGQVAALLASGELERHGSGVALAPSVRLALASQPVLTGWVTSARAAPGAVAAASLDTIRDELRAITRRATGLRLPDELNQRAAELAGVLATAELDPEAMALVASTGGQPRRQLLQLLTVPERSCATLKELRTELSRVVSTIYQER